MASADEMTADERADRYAQVTGLLFQALDLCEEYGFDFDEACDQVKHAL